MKNRLIFTLLGGIVLFLWQFMAWAMPAFHWDSISYTPLQEQILSALDASGLETGMYVLGQPDPDTYEQEGAVEAFQAAHEGKSYARIHYQRQHTYSMGMNMLRGLLACFLMAFLLHALLNNLKQDGLMQRIVHAAGFGLVFFLFIPYTNFIWFKDPDIWAFLADGLVPWTILGAISAKMA